MRSMAGWRLSSSVILQLLSESQMAERLGNGALNQKVAGSIPAVQYDVVSLGKALHPTCLGGMSLYLL